MKLADKSLPVQKNNSNKNRTQPVYDATENSNFAPGV